MENKYENMLNALASIEKEGVDVESLKIIKKQIKQKLEAKIKKEIVEDIIDKLYLLGIPFNVKNEIVGWISIRYGKIQKTNDTTKNKLKFSYGNDVLDDKEDEFNKIINDINFNLIDEKYYLKIKSLIKADYFSENKTNKLKELIKFKDVKMEQNNE